MGRYRDYDTGSRETEDEILRLIGDICDKAYQRRKLNGDEADLIVDEANHRIGSLAADLDRYVDGSNYVTETELQEFAVEATNVIIADLTRAASRRGSSDRGRDRDRGRSPSRIRFAEDRRESRDTGFGLSGGSRDLPSDNNRKSPSRTRAQIASEASNRQRQEEKEVGQGRVTGNTSVPRVENPPRAAKHLPAGVDCTANYAIVGSLGGECPISLSTLEIPPSVSKMYNNLQHHGILVDNAITVDHREIQMNVAFGNVFNAVNFLKEIDNLLFSPDDYCHIIHFPKISLASLPGLGEPLFQASAEIKKFLQDSTKQELDMTDRLSEIASILNQVNPKIRSAIMNRVLRRWNVVARSSFCIPETPNEYLEAANWEHLLRFCAPVGGTSVDPVLVNIREKLEYFTEKKGKQFTMKLYAVMEDVLADLYRGNNGFIDIRKEHLEYVTGWDELPICIDQQYRPRDILSMTDDQRKSLAAQFMKNYCCMVEDMTVIVTNLNTADLKVHRDNNHIVALDIPTVRVLQSRMEKSSHPHLLYTTDTRGNNLNYVGHCGISLDSGIQLVTLKDNY